MAVSIAQRNCQIFNENSHSLNEIDTHTAITTNALNALEALLSGVRPSTSNYTRPITHCAQRYLTSLSLSLSFSLPPTQEDELKDKQVKTQPIDEQRQHSGGGGSSSSNEDDDNTNNNNSVKFGALNARGGPQKIPDGADVQATTSTREERDALAKEWNKKE